MEKFLKRLGGKTLFELLVTITLIGIFITCSYLKNMLRHSSTHKQLCQLKIVQQTIQLARSVAIKLQQKVYLCPTKQIYNNHNYYYQDSAKHLCLADWEGHLTMFTISQDQQHINILNSLPLSFNHQKLLIKFFGSQHNTKITLLPNGTTVNNGHFCLLNFAYCLYLNKAGKTYITKNHTTNNEL